MKKTLLICSLLLLGVPGIFSQQPGFAKLYGQYPGQTPGMIPARKFEAEKLHSAILFADSLIENDNRQSFKNVESMIIMAPGDVKFEKYYNGFEKGSLHQIQSQTKSIVSILTGIAIDKGFIKNENEPVSLYFPEFFNVNDPLKSIVTIRDMLTMSAGFKWEESTPFEDPGNDNRKMFQSGNWLQYALSRPMAQEPGSGFQYNSGCPMIIAGILEKATKMKLDSFASEYLFEPLEINNFSWLKDVTGMCHAGGGLFLEPSDMAKIGLMILNKGKWNNLQVVSEEWISKATTSYMTTSLDISTYGYFWWIREMRINESKTTRIISAEGAGGQKLYILPEYQMVIAFTEQNYSTPQVGSIFLRESVLPLLE